MTQVLIQPSQQELITATVENYIENMRTFACLPQCTFHQDHEFTWLIANGPPGDGVFLTRLQADEAPIRVTQTLQYLRKHAHHGWWQVLPTSQPANLGTILLANGLLRGVGRPVMIFDLTNLSDQVSPSRLQIKRVENTTMLHEWMIASGQGFEMKPKDVQVYFDAYQHHGFDPDGMYHHYTGYVDNQAVTSATLLLAGGIAGIYNVSTIPTARYQGWGYQITLATLHAASQLGYRYVTLQSSVEAYSLYYKLGFRDLYREENYEW